ncbi:MAG: SDR family oxidoreductase [Terricaulis sp.]
MIGVNLKHYFFATQAVLPGMRRARAGSIITYGLHLLDAESPGLSGLRDVQFRDCRLSMVHAAEFGDDRIRVNTLTPGWIMTQKQVDLWMTPQGEKDLEKGQLLKERLHEPDVARLALFLAADDSRLITAQNYLVDAGWA